MIETDWDIESYKTDHESNEHWELRRKFMVTHKDRLPEDELVCLAQVFTNIEFLGCRYPNETMIRVAELAKGVVEEFRDKKKNTLKRTFVAASDAASSKVKGIKQVKGNTDSRKESTISFIPSSDKKNILQPLEGPFSKFILIIMTNKTEFQSLERSMQINRSQNSRFDTEQTENGLMKCSVILEGIEISSAVAVDRKSAQQLASSSALSKLSEQCYSILEDSDLVGQTVQVTDVGKNTAVSSASNTESVGTKLMRLMGWAGGGLGSDGQGRVDPVEATTCLRRSGFGSGAITPHATGKQFRQDVCKFLHKWLGEGAKSDLVFSSDFDKEQRKIAHEVASHLGLKSKSYGKDNDRRLVISKKVSLWDLAQELHEAGGRTDKYQLLKPGHALPSKYYQNPDGAILRT